MRRWECNPRSNSNPLKVKLKLKLKPNQAHSNSNPQSNRKNLREGAGWCVMSVWPSVTAVFSAWATNLFQLGGSLYTVGLVPWWGLCTLNLNADYPPSWRIWPTQYGVFDPSSWRIWPNQLAQLTYADGAVDPRVWLVHGLRQIAAVGLFTHLRGCFYKYSIRILFFYAPRDSFTFESTVFTR